MKTLRDFDNLPDTALVRLPMVQTLLPWSRTTIWRRVRDGSIPAPIRMPGSTCIAWRAGDIRRVLASVEQAA